MSYRFRLYNKVGIQRRWTKVERWLSSQNYPTLFQIDDKKLAMCMCKGCAVWIIHKSPIFVKNWYECTSVTEVIPRNMGKKTIFIDIDKNDICIDVYHIVYIISPMSPLCFTPELLLSNTYGLYVYPSFCQTNDYGEKRDYRHYPQINVMIGTTAWWRRPGYAIHTLTNH